MQWTDQTAFEQC